MDRRGFLKACLAAAAAPAIVRADSLMKIVARDTEVLVPYETTIIIDQMRNVRSMAWDELVGWYTKVWEEALYKELTKPSFVERVLVARPDLPRVVVDYPLIDARASDEPYLIVEGEKHYFFDVPHV